MAKILNFKYFKCKKCGDTHDDIRFKLCIICRIANALYHKEWRHDHIKRKLCTECRQSSKYILSGNRRFKKCEKHLKYHREYMKWWNKREKQTNLVLRKHKR